MRASAFADRETEAAFTTRVIKAAMLRGWLVTHFLPARTASGGHRTALQGHRGFPDLVLARDGVVIFAELKTNRGTLGPGQPEWLAVLGALAVVWRPRDWDDIERTLNAPRTRSAAPAAAPGPGHARVLAEAQEQVVALRAQLDHLAQLWHDRLSDPTVPLGVKIRRDTMAPGAELAAALDILLPD